ncbi:hypothetical protein KEJ33_01390 [Candidatus Bathyarchaeota archaeon]|nr:hypothetical protein [Candidatus Bathyarchaeota archaeon]
MEKSSFSVRLGLYTIFEELCSRTKIQRMIKMAKRVDEVEFNEQMFASLIKKLITEKRKVRQY